MKHSKKTIAPVLILVAIIAVGAYIYSTQTKEAVTPIANETVTPTENTGGEQKKAEEGTSKDIVDTTPHVHPAIGTVPEKPSSVDAAVYEQTKGKMQEAINTVQKNSRDYEAWLTIAIYEYSVFKNEKRAEEIWKFIEKDRPLMIQPVLNLAQLYFKRGDLVLAEGYFKKAIANEPKYIQSYSDLYSIYRTQGKSQEAIEILKQGIIAEPKEHYLNYILAGYYLELGKKTEALAQFEESLKRAKVTGNEEIIKAIQADIDRLK